MKRVLNYIILFIVLVFPFSVKAYGIENYFMHVKILNNGDAEVQEYIHLNDEYNGFERIILYENSNAIPWDENALYYGGSTIHNGSGIEMLEIRETDFDDNFDFTNVSGRLYNKVATADKGTSGVYVENGTSFLIYHPNTLNKAFYIKYKINDLAILHNDYGELGLNLVGKELRESIHRFKAIIEIPDNKNDLKAWAHGPLNGKVSLIDKNKVEVSINNVPNYTSFDVRVLFDKEILKNCKKNTNVDALDKILVYESDAANLANDIRNEYEAVKYLESFEKDLYKYNLYEASNYINKIKNVDKRNELFNRLDIANEKLILKSLEYLEKNVLTKKDIIPREEFEEVEDYIYYLDNKNVKEKYLKKYNDLKSKKIEKEKNIEIRNYIKSISILVIIIIIIIIFFYKDYKKYKSYQVMKYLREVPDDLTPTSVSYLFNKKITPNSLSASILSLIDRNIIRVEKEQDDYVFYNESKNKKITILEEKIINFLFITKEKTTIKKIKQHYKKYPKKYLTYWDAIKKQAKIEADKEEMFNKKKLINPIKKKKDINIFIVYLLLVLILLFMPMIFLILLLIFYIYIIYNNNKDDKLKTLSSILLEILFFVNLFIFIKIFVSQIFIKYSLIIYAINMVLIISFVIYTLCYKKRTDRGIEKLAKWSAFKNFLKDFGRFDVKTIQEVKIWNSYLIYATLFGYSKKILKKFNSLFKDYSLNYAELYNDTEILYDVSYLVQHNIRSLCNRSIVTSISKDFQNIGSGSSSDSSGSSYSSSSGSGGGFSSGGGSFGGGGGGGRF